MGLWTEQDEALFHRLWTKAVGTRDYDKAEWQFFAARVGELVKATGGYPSLAAHLLAQRRSYPEELETAPTSPLADQPASGQFVGEVPDMVKIEVEGGEFYAPASLADAPEIPVNPQTGLPETFFGIPATEADEPIRIGDPADIESRWRKIQEAALKEGERLTAERDEWREKYEEICEVLREQQEAQP